MAEPLAIHLPAPLTGVRVVPGGGAPSADGAAGADAPDGGSDEAEEALAAEREALEAERAALASARRALQSAAARAADLLPEILAEAEAHLVDLAVEIARKVVAQEIETERCDIEPIVREALARAPQQRECVVHLHPDDLSVLRDAEAPAADLEHLRLEADPGLGRGECRVETPEGTVESRIADRLDQVRDAMNPSEPS